MTQDAFAKLEVSKLDTEQYESYSPSGFLQAGFWARYKASFGWRPYFFKIKIDIEDRPNDLALSVMVRKIAGPFHVAYVPHAPDFMFVTSVSSAINVSPSQIMSHLSDCISRNVDEFLVFVRWDLPWIVSAKNVSDQPENETEQDPDAIMRDLHRCLVKSEADIQPPDTILIPLEDEASVLAGMKPKTRYNVRLAEKKGVSVRACGPELLPEWYKLYQATAERDRIAIHSYEYYRKLVAENPDSVELLMAYHEADCLAGIVVVYSGDKATYLYGASGNVKRNLMPAYALQWIGIKRAIARGCTVYDLFGLPKAADPDHPMFGLFQFKSGFGGRLVSYAGTWDWIRNRMWYSLYRRAEAIRLWYYKKAKKSR